MKDGTSKKPKYLQIHMLRENLKQTVPGVETILSFHAITGCDTVSYFAGHSKKTSWKTFTEHQRLLRNLENGDLDDSTVRSVETFICRISSVTDAENCNIKRMQRCFLDAGHQKLFPQRVMQCDGILEGRTSKQWYGNKRMLHTPHYKTEWQAGSQAYVSCPRTLNLGRDG